MNTMLKTIIPASLAALLILLAACDPIGYNIEQEEKLSEAVIKGNVYSMVPVQKRLYVQNGRIYTAAFEGGAWSTAGKPEEAIIQTLASDSSWLYAKDRNGSVWAAAASETGLDGSWTRIYAGTGREVFLFDNGVAAADGSTTGRTAWINYGDGARPLHGTAAPGAPVSGTSGATRNCVQVNGTDIFTGKSMVAVCGTTLYSVVSEKADNSAGSRTLCYSTDGINWTSISSQTGEAVTCLAAGSQNTLLVGTVSNYEEWTARGAQSAGSSAADTYGTIQEYRFLSIFEYAGIRYAGVTPGTTSVYSGLWYQKANGRWDKA